MSAAFPTKVLLHHADIYDHFKRAEEFGFEVKDVKVNWPAILARKDKIVKKHAQWHFGTLQEK